MTLPTRPLGVLAVAATAALLAIPSAASARAGDRTFQETYPVASKLCTEVAAGKRKRLHRFATRVLADCAVLQSAFTADQSEVLAARATLGSAVAVDRAAIVVACPPPMVGHPSCEHIRTTENVAVGALRRQLVDAALRYFRVAETHRLIFWREIHAIPGERRLPTDLPIAAHNS
jgi:hypothetical protein